jgi:hypothetical protein
MRIAGGLPSSTRRFVAVCDPADIGPDLSANESDSIVRIKIAGLVERLTIRGKKDRKIDGIGPRLKSKSG